MVRMSKIVVHCHCTTVHRTKRLHSIVLPPPPPLPPLPPDPLLLLFLLEVLLRSSRSLMTEKGSLASLPSSNRSAKWDGPTAICLTSSRMFVRAVLPTMGSNVVTLLMQTKVHFFDNGSILSHYLVSHICSVCLPRI